MTKLEYIVTGIGLVTSIIVIAQGYSWWKNKQSKSSVDVVTSAVQLLRPYQEEVDRLSKKLETANSQILDMTQKLNNAENRANDLNNLLVDAQAEVGYLRTQVKVLSKQLEKDQI